MMEMHSCREHDGCMVVDGMCVAGRMLDDLLDHLGEEDWMVG